MVTRTQRESDDIRLQKKQKIAEYTRSVFDKDDVIARDVTTRDVTRGCERYYVDDEPPVSAHYVLDTDRLYPYDHVTASRYATAVNYLMPSQGTYVTHTHTSHTVCRRPSLTPSVAT